MIPINYYSYDQFVVNKSTLKYQFNVFSIIL